MFFKSFQREGVVMVQCIMLVLVSLVMTVNTAVQCMCMCVMYACPA
jgi:hypothetical protein